MGHANVSSSEIKLEIDKNKRLTKKQRLLRIGDFILAIFNVEKSTAKMAVLVFYSAFIMSGICYFVALGAVSNNEYDAQGNVMNNPGAKSIANIDIYISLIYFCWTILTTAARFRHTRHYHNKFFNIKNRINIVKGNETFIAYQKKKFYVFLAIFLLALIFLGIIFIFILYFFIPFPNKRQVKTGIRISIYIISTISMIFFLTRTKVILIRNKGKENAEPLALEHKATETTNSTANEQKSTL